LVTIENTYADPAEPTELREVPEGTPEAAGPTENENEAMKIQAVPRERVENLKGQGAELETLMSL